MVAAAAPEEGRASLHGSGVFMYICVSTRVHIQVHTYSCEQHTFLVISFLDICMTSNVNVYTYMYIHMCIYIHSHVQLLGSGPKVCTNGAYMDL